MLTRDNLFKIGVGTWGIGGLDKRNPENKDNEQIAGMAYALEKGENFIEANLWYADGYSANLTAKALTESGKKRADIFLSQTVYTQSAPDLTSAKEELKKFADLFNTDYVDTFQFSIKNLVTYGKGPCVELSNELLANKTARYVSIANADLATLKWFKEIFGDKVFSHELIHNFEIRSGADNGSINYTNENHILNVIAQPLRRNRTAQQNWPLLTELSKKYGFTQNQILINWLTAQGFLVIIKAVTKAHIDENLSSLSFKMTDQDIKLLNDFRVPDFIPPETDWYWTGKGVPAHMQPNIFDDEYAKQKLSPKL